MGGTHGVSGGTGKAEDAKLQDAGISLKQCQENEWQKKAANETSKNHARAGSIGADLR